MTDLIPHLETNHIKKKKNVFVPLCFFTILPLITHDATKNPCELVYYNNLKIAINKSNKKQFLKILSFSKGKWMNLVTFEVILCSKEWQTGQIKRKLCDIQSSLSFLIFWTSSCFASVDFLNLPIFWRVRWQIRILSNIYWQNRH